MTEPTPAAPRSLERDVYAALTQFGDSVLVDPLALRLVPLPHEGYLGQAVVQGFVQPLDDLTIPGLRKLLETYHESYVGRSLPEHPYVMLGVADGKVGANLMLYLTDLDRALRLFVAGQIRPDVYDCRTGYTISPRIGRSPQ